MGTVTQTTHIDYSFLFGTDDVAGGNLYLSEPRVSGA